MLFSNKDLKNLLCPLVIEQVLVMLVGMVDTVMVSSVGETAVSGVALVCVLSQRAILSLFFGAVETAVMDAALTYFFVTACSFPFLGIYNAAAAQFRAMGRTNVTMYVSALMNVLNIIGDLTGVFLLRAGVLGVAVPTLISRAVAAVLLSALPSVLGIRCG